jgi:DNA modification methylase
MKKNPIVKEDAIPAGLGKVLLAHLIPDAKNPRKDLKKGDPEFEKIQNSIGKFGQLDPIIYNTRTRKILGGHQRLKVLDAKGYTELYTITLGAYTWAFAEADLKELSEKEEIAANIALNKAQGDWQMDQLMINLQELKAEGMDISITGFDEKEFDGLLRELHKDDEPLDSEPQISRAEELQKEWGTEPGQLWQCGEHRVICGDCTDPAVVARIMGGGMADLLVTDPPYGVSYASKNEFLNAVGRGNCIQTPIENDHMKPEDMSALWIKSFSNVRKSVKAGASYYVTGPQVGDLLLLFLLALKESGFPLRHMLIWAKNNHVLGRSDYHYQHEPIIYGWVDGSHSFYGGHSQTSLWFVDKPHKSDLHPTMKPVALFLKAIENSTKEEDIVLDPFLGSGTTMIACENLGRKCRGVEVDPGYVAVCLERYKTTFNKVPVLLEGD